ncbi:MAG: CARDB domain-containing protein [Deltaproteobacteria bacterium]
MTLYGGAYSTIWVNANGWVSVLDNANGYHLPPATNPSTDFPNGYVAPLWADWCSSVNGCVGFVNAGVGIYYEVDVTPGAGRVTIEWRNVRHFADDTMASDVDFSVTLYEGARSTIEMRYGEARPGINVPGNFTDFMARIGIEAPSPSQGMFVGPCVGATPCSTGQVQSLQDTKITILEDIGEDLTVTAVSTDETTVAGRPLPVTVRLASRHGMPLGPFTFQAQLLDPAATSTVGAPVLYTSGPVTLPGFATQEASFDLLVPIATQDGDYRVAITIDAADVIAEIDETNNVAFSGVVSIDGRGPDLRARRIVPRASTAAPGGTLELTYTVDNFGNVPATFDAQVVLSKNDTISLWDHRLGPVATYTLDSLESSSATITPTLPELPTGRYRLGLVVDPAFAVAELDERNNILASGQTVTVISDDVAVLTPSLPVAVLGVPYDVTLEAAGGDGSFVWSLSSGTVPPGVAFQGGRIYGVPLGVGDHPISVRVRSGDVTSTADFTLTVLDPDYPLRLVTRDLPDGYVGADYDVALRAVGGRPPYRFRTIAGRPTDGLELRTDGHVVGVPGASGIAVFTVEVSDEDANTATVAYSLEVRAPGNLTVVSGALPDATLQEPYTQTLFASGGTPPLRWRVLTELPPGIVVAEEGLVNGIPELAGPQRFLVQATDAAGQTDTSLLELVVRSDGLLRITTDRIPEAVLGADYDVTIEVNGGARPFLCEVVRSEGFLPPGLTSTQKDGDETTNALFIRGVPEARGTWPFTVRCTDKNLRVAEAVFPLVVVDPPPPVEEEGGCGCTTTSRRGAAWSLLLLLLLIPVRPRRVR